MITRKFADRFAQEWIDAWNSHNLERVLAHYSDDFEMSSPHIAKIAGEPSGMLKGKPAIATYWEQALEQLPALHFELHSTLLGAESLVIYYRGARGMAAEVFPFGPTGKVVRACAHYA
jgi:hypothetical protein